MKAFPFILLSIAACDSSVIPEDAGYDAATQDSPSPDATADDVSVGVDASDAAVVDASDAAADSTLEDASDADDDASDAADDAASDATTVVDASGDAGGCTTNKDCLIGEYCERGDGNCTGSGACKTIPIFCPNIVSLVCGCDGVTYDNSCKAHRGATCVDHTGKCP
jgi:hypothetical protein